MARKVVNLYIRMRDGVTGVLTRINSGIGKTIRAFGRLTKSIGISGIAFGALIADAAKFNITMARVWTMAGGGIETFRRLRQEARNLASDFGMTRAEISKGMYGALSAGVGENDLVEFMNVAAKAAVSDGSSIEGAVDGITTVLDSFGMEAKDATKIADLMFQAVAKGKLTFGELAHSISEAASVASVMGVSAEEVMGAVAVLSKTQATAKSTINLRNIMLSLNKALGEGWSATMTLQEALNKVYDDAGGSQMKLEKIFGRENLPAMLKLSGDNAEAAAQGLADMAGSAGAADKAFNKVDQFRHWPKLIETARAQLSRFFEVINQRIAPAINTIRDRIREIGDSGALENMANRVADIVESAKKAVEVLAGGGEGRTRILNAFGNVLKEAFKAAANGAAMVLVKIAPKVGMAIGKGLMDALNIKRTPAHIKEQEDKIQGLIDKQNSRVDTGSRRNRWRDRTTGEKWVIAEQIGEAKKELWKMREAWENGEVSVDPANLKESLDHLNSEIERTHKAMLKAEEKNNKELVDGVTKGAEKGAEAGTEKGSEKGTKSGNAPLITQSKMKDGISSGKALSGADDLIESLMAGQGGLTRRESSAAIRDLIAKGGSEQLGDVSKLLKRLESGQGGMDRQGALSAIGEIFKQGGSVEEITKVLDALTGGPEGMDQSEALASILELLKQGNLEDAGELADLIDVLGRGADDLSGREIVAELMRILQALNGSGESSGIMGPDVPVTKDGLAGTKVEAPDTAAQLVLANTYLKEIAKNTKGGVY